MSNNWNDDIFTADGYILHHTDNAILLDFEGEEYWLPKTEIRNLHELDLNESEVVQDIDIPNWLAKTKDMI